MARCNHRRDQDQSTRVLDDRRASIAARFRILPILLLGLQFLVLVILKAGAALPVEWIGLGLVLTSSTVLMTARTVADVYRQRTGGNLRPLPWNILAPLMVGVTLSLIGVLVSFYGFSYGPTTTRAVVPTALIAGAMMFVVARQTNQQAFTGLVSYCSRLLIRVHRLC